MVLKRTTLERSLEQAQESQKAWEDALDKQGVAEADRSKDTRWRSLDGDRRTILRRLKSVTATETLSAEVAARRNGSSSEEE